MSKPVHLTEKLRKLIALWRGTTIDGERQAARAAIERMLPPGVTVEQAVSAYHAAEAAKPGANPFASAFAGFDDYMEAKEPGHKVLVRSNGGIARQRC